MESTIDLRLLRLRLVRHLGRLVKTLYVFKMMNRNGRSKIQNERYKWLWWYSKFCWNWLDFIFQGCKNGSNSDLRKCPFFLDLIRSICRISIFLNNRDGRGCFLKSSLRHAKTLRKNCLDKFARQLKETGALTHKLIRIINQKVSRP